MDILPNEIIYEILDYVNFEQRIVCKAWKEYIEYKKLEIYRNKISLGKKLDKNANQQLHRMIKSLISEIRFEKRFCGVYVSVREIRKNCITMFIGGNEIFFRDDDGVEYHRGDLHERILEEIKNIKDMYYSNMKDIFFAIKFVRNKINQIDKKKVHYEIIYHESYDLIILNGGMSKYSVSHHEGIKFHRVDHISSYEHSKLLSSTIKIIKNAYYQHL